MPLSHKARLRLEKSALFTALLVPLLLTAWHFARDELGANPVEAATHQTGLWALRILLLALTVTPLRIAFRWRRPLLFRRMLGLFAFTYATAHFLIYLVFDQQFDLGDMLKDVGKRPYITVGFAAFVLMLPLVATSTNKMVKRLGGKRWRTLHKLAYAVAVLAVLHFLWLVKADLSEPLMYGGILVFLFGVRGYERVKARSRARSRADVRS